MGKIGALQLKINMLNREYWTEYYKDHPPEGPSPFCLWVGENYGNVLKGSILVDVCAGNGRDTEYLSKRCKFALGVDAAYSSMMVQQTNLSHFVRKHQPPNILYARFAFHAITSRQENLLLEWGWQYLMAEMRSDKGVVPDDTHKRRLINAEMLKYKLQDCEILHFEEDYGLAKTETEDPCIIRVVAKR